jgi:hypothetical protein
MFAMGPAPAFAAIGAILEDDMKMRPVLQLIFRLLSFTLFPVKMFPSFEKGNRQ